jgi:hypothetical protein
VRQTLEFEEANQTRAVKVEATDLVLLDCLEGGTFGLLFRIVAKDDPAIVAHNI